MYDRLLIMIDQKGIKKGSLLRGGLLNDLKVSNWSDPLANSITLDQKKGRGGGGGDRSSIDDDASSRVIDHPPTHPPPFLIKES